MLASRAPVVSGCGAVALGHHGYGRRLVMVRLWFVSTVDSRGRVWRTSVRAASSWHAAALVSGRVVSVVDGGAV